MSDLLAFETAPFDQLCNCVAVELTPNQDRLMGVWPEKGPNIVKAAMQNGQQRHVDGECQHCNGTGLLASKAA